MKIKVEIDEDIEKEEIVIRCKNLNDEIAQLQKLINNAINLKNRIVFFKGDIQYYLDLNDVLFFETEGDKVYAHTSEEIYIIKYRLYELEEILPGYFLRISKSAILNVNRIFSIDRNLASSSLVSFQNTHKKVYISRRYLKPLTDRLEKRG